MMLEEVRTGYDIQDILDEVEEQLGFSFVNVTTDSGYFLISGKIKFYLEFEEGKDVYMEVRLPEKNIDVTENESMIELYSSSLESISQIRNIIVDMMGGEIIDDNLWGREP